MSSNSCSKADLSGELSLLNIDVNESNNEEMGGGSSNAEIINAATVCANCGKEGDGDSMNSCNKCDLVQYCTAACKKKHRHKHKKECEGRVAELYDEKLFQDPPPPEECPICFLPLPLLEDQITFETCCGKDICNGCIVGMVEINGADLCAFCRTPYARSDEEEVERVKKLMEKGHAYAINQLAGYYAQGELGIPRDRAKANELYLKAGELGCAEAYFNLGNAYDNGRGVEIDKQKAKYFYELAAIGGDLSARHNLGCSEGQVGNLQRAYKHFILAAKAGHDKALGMVKQGFMKGDVTKDEYANTLRAYQKSKDEMKSEARDKAEDVMAWHRAAS